MSTRKPRKRTNTTIEYDYSEWDAEKPRHHRERSNSVDLLQELRRSHRVHAPTQSIPARFGDHYCNEEHVITVPNGAPNTTFAKSFRYGKEPNKIECHEWRRKGQDTANRGIQCELKPPQRSCVVQCTPASREMNVQTHKWYPETVSVKKSSRDKGVQATKYEGANYDELIALIKSLNTRPIKSGSNLPDGLMDHIVGALAELRALLEALKRTTDVVSVKEDEILSAVKNIRVTGGEGVPDGLIETVNQTFTIVKRLATTEDCSNIRGLVAELSNAIGMLKEEHSHILRAINSFKSSSFSEEYYMKITAFLQEILGYLRVEEVQVKVTRRQLYDGRCRCAEIGEAARAIYRASDALLPSLCQRCTNDLKGRTFVQSLSLPMSLTADIVNTLGKAIECIERDDEFNLEMLLQECRQQVSEQWDPKTHQITYEALFHLALLWQSQKTSVILAGLVNVHVMVKSLKDEHHPYRFPDYIQDAIDGKNLAVLEKLFGAMTDQERLMVINSPMVKPKGRTLPLFVAAREGDVDIFTFIVMSGASLDAREADRSILHELAWISHEKRDSPKLKEWNKALVSMVGVVCDRAGHWWERQLLHAAWTGCTEASRTNALHYIFSVQDSKGLNALQFAARYASPEIIRKIVSNPPYEFTPDPIEFGHDNGLKGYVVDQIESRLARKNHSILERMLLRDPLDGAKVMAIEPFKSMIDDKWKRYQIFYAIWFICYMCFMTMYTAVAIDRPIGKSTYAEMYQTNSDYGRMVGEIFIVACLPLFFYGEIRDGIRMGFIVPRPWLRTGMFRILTFCFVLLTIVVVVLRLTFNPGENIPLGLALLLGWLLALEFLGAWQNIGMFATILHRVVYNDVALKFFLVWFIMIAGTSAATYVAFQESVEQSLLQETFPNGSFWYTPLSLFKVSFALLDGDYATRATYPPFGVLLFIAFVFLFNFLLFNLLIAMMADTYSRSRAKINRSWIWVKANYALLMDRRLPNFMSISYLDNKQGGFARLASTKLRYLTRQVKRRVKGGNVVEVSEHVVLVATEDLPKPAGIQPKDLDNLTSDLLATPRD